MGTQSTVYATNAAAGHGTPLDMDTMVNRGSFHEESMEYLENNDRGLVVLDAKRRRIDNFGRREDRSDNKTEQEIRSKNEIAVGSVSGTHQEI